MCVVLSTKLPAAAGWLFREIEEYKSEPANYGRKYTVFLPVESPMFNPACCFSVAFGRVRKSYCVGVSTDVSRDVKRLDLKGDLVKRQRTGLSPEKRSSRRESAHWYVGHRGESMSLVCR